MIRSRPNRSSSDEPTLIRNQQVSGSSPLVGSSLGPRAARAGLLLCRRAVEPQLVVLVVAHRTAALRSATLVAVVRAIVVRGVLAHVHVPPVPDVIGLVVGVGQERTDDRAGGGGEEGRRRRVGLRGPRERCGGDDCKRGGEDEGVRSFHVDHLISAGLDGSDLPKIPAYQTVAR